MERFLSGYRAVITDHIDPRSQDWLLASSPLVPCTIVTLYLLVVKKWGPSFMAQRAAFKIEPLIIVFNIVQIIACFHIFWTGTVFWFRLKYSFVCQPVDPAVNEANDTVASLVYLYYILKISDLLDTVFFILRRKFSHASFLHVYHHAGMVFVGYLACRFSLNGHFVLLGIVNSFVHVVMYMYYLVTALFPDRRPPNSVKKWLTILQLAQFYSMLVHEALPLVQSSCTVQKFWCAILIVQYTFMIILFTDFYKKAYSSPSKKSE